MSQTKKPKKAYRECMFCREQKQNVYYRIDPYSSQIYKDNTKVDMCDDCENERKEAI